MNLFNNYTIYKYFHKDGIKKTIIIKTYNIYHLNKL